MCIKLFVVLKIFPPDLCKFCSDSSCFTQILVICVFLFWSVLLEVCQFFKIFSIKINFHYFLFRWFFLFSLFSACLIIIQFLLFALDLFCSSSRFLKQEFRWLIWDFSIFFNVVAHVVNFFLSSILTVSHKFWYVAFLFSFISMYF